MPRSLLGFVLVAAVAASAPLSAQVSITLLLPSTATAGGPGLTFSVVGTGFVSGHLVQWDGANLPTTFVSSVQLNATLTAAQIATAGVHAVRVRIFAGVPPFIPPTFTNTVNFTVNNPVPNATSINPISVAAGVSNLSLLVVGSNFNASTVATANGAPLTVTSQTATSLNAIVPTAMLATPGTLTIAVSNPAPGGGSDTAGTLSVTAPAPVLTSIAPSTVFVDAGATTLTVVGSGFSPSSVVQLAPPAGSFAPLATTFVSTTQLTAVAPASELLVPGSPLIRVFSPGPGGGFSAQIPLSVQYPVPTVTALSPAAIPAGAPSPVVTINGTGFYPGPVTTIGIGLPGDPPMFITPASATPTQLTFTTPPFFAQVGAVLDVVVKNVGPGGGQTPPTTLTVLNPAPTLSSVTPNDIPVGSPPTTLVLSGTGFNAASVVKFNTGALATTFVSATTLTALLPTMNSGEVNDVRVENPAPGGGLSAPQTVVLRLPAPTLTSLSIASVEAGGVQTVVSVFGSGFFSGCVVAVDGAPVPTTFVSSTQLSAVIGAGSAFPGASRAVSAINDTPNAGGSNVLSLPVVAPEPILTGFAPTTLQADASPTTLVLSGLGLYPTTVVSVDGVPTPVSGATGSALTIVVPGELAQVTGFRTVDVVNPPPGGGAASFLIPANGPVLSALFPATIPPLGPGAAPVNVTLSGTFPHPGTTEIRVDGRPASFVVLNATTAAVQIDPSMPFVGFPGGLAITAVATVPVPGAKPVASNALGLRIGSATSPDNLGTVSVLPRHAAPNEAFFVRVEAPTVDQPTTLVADFAQPAPFTLAFDPNFDLAIGVLFGAPTALADGLGLLGPPTGAALRFDPLVTFGAPGLRGVFDLRGFVAPATPLGVSFTLQAVYLDPTQPFLFNATFPSRQTL